MSQTVELLRSAARDFDNGGDNILWKGPALRELASQLSELTPERVSRLRECVEDSMHNDACARMVGGECIVPELENCKHPPCVELAAVLRALAALAGSTNG